MLRATLYEWIVSNLYERKASTLYDCLAYSYPGALDILNYLDMEIAADKTAVRCMSSAETLALVKAWRRWPFFKESMIYEPNKVLNTDDDVDGGNIVEMAFNTW